jgi:hypothetical protein
MLRSSLSMPVSRPACLCLTPLGLPVFPLLARGRAQGWKKVLESAMLAIPAPVLPGAPFPSA